MFDSSCLFNTPNTKVYLFDVSCLQDVALFQQTYIQASPQRRAKVEAMQGAKGKCLSLGVEYLLLQACRDFGVDYAKQTLETNPYGKPCFRGLPVHFNLSHSGERALCIMSKYEVGCDVERRRPYKVDIARRFFSSSEVELLEQLGTGAERQQLFFKLWTLKESFMKCVGRGFNLPLKDFSIVLAGDRISVLQSLDDAEYSLFTRDSQDGYHYSWCIRK